MEISRTIVRNAIDVIVTDTKNSRVRSDLFEQVKTAFNILVWIIVVWVFSDVTTSFFPEPALPKAILNSIIILLLLFFLYATAKIIESSRELFRQKEDTPSTTTITIGGDVHTGIIAGGYVSDTTITQVARSETGDLLKQFARFYDMIKELPDTKIKNRDEVVMYIQRIMKEIEKGENANLERIKSSLLVLEEEGVVPLLTDTLGTRNLNDTIQRIESDLK